MAKNTHESGYKIGRDISGRGGSRDYAVFPVLERRFMLPAKQTGLFVEVKRAEPAAKRGPLGGVVYTAAVHGGSPDLTSANLRRQDSDPKLGSNKARKAQRAGRRLGESWLDNTSNSQVRAMIKDRQPRVYGRRS